MRGVCFGTGTTVQVASPQRSHKAQCHLTHRSSGAPSAGRRAREAVMLIIVLAGPTPCRCRPLSSNVRPRIRHPVAHHRPSEHQSMHQGSCHCGAVRLTIPSIPTSATSCNCSLCRRIGGPWVYFEFGTVEIQGHPENTEDYIQGDGTLKTIRCRTCGSVTHWEPIDIKPGAKHGVHLGNFDPEFTASIKVRKFDGANTWKFFDEIPPNNEPEAQGEA